MIAKNSQLHKRPRRSTSKQIDFKKHRGSVTHGAGGASQRPSKPHERLRPWLEIANLLSPPPLRDELERPSNALVSILRVNRWEAEFRNLSPAEIVRRFERSPSAHEGAFVATRAWRLLTT